MQSFMPLIFVVGGDLTYNDFITKYLQNRQLGRIKSFSSIEECLSHFREKPQIIIIDDSSKGMDSISFLLKAKSINPHIEFILLSNQSKVETAVSSLKYGAFDYIIKDTKTLSKLAFGINRIITLQNKEKENRLYRLCVILFIIILTAIILMVIGLTILFPKQFPL